MINYSQFLAKANDVVTRTPTILSNLVELVQVLEGTLPANTTKLTIFLHGRCERIPQIKRDTRTQLPSCVMVLSAMGLQWGIRVLIHNLRRYA